MKICVFGLGYVGSVSAACLARDGHTVIGVDINPQKVEAVNAGRSPVVEPGLEELVGAGVRSGRLRATLEERQTVRDTELSLICVGTPSHANGSLDLTYVEDVVREVGEALSAEDAYHVVVVRSTVLPGTVRERILPLLEQTSGRRAGAGFGLCMNPEFLREGSAIHDYDHPSHVVIGEIDSRSGRAVEQLYGAIHAPVVRTRLENAEMLKYVNNAFHAFKIAFANEVGNLCKAHGIDGREVMEIFGQDRQLNISTAYLRPGFAFGGPCLPKDARALLYRAKERDVEVPLLSAALASNRRQIERGIEMVERTGRRRVGVLGLSFKPGTDDVRESPVVPLVETLYGRGYQVRIYDERVDLGRLLGANRTFLGQEIPHIASLMRPSIEDVVAQSEVIVVANASPAFGHVQHLIRSDQVLIDLAGVSGKNGEIRGKYEGICW